jgi:hypothetical protein
MEREAPDQGAILTDYLDPALTDDKLYQGALQPVSELRREEPVRDSNWLVIVQEPVER